jgi:hypothetical protein
LSIFDARVRHELWPAPQEDAFVGVVVLFVVVLVAVMGLAVLLVMTAG